MSTNTMIALGAAALGFLTASKKKRMVRAAIFGVAGMFLAPKVAGYLPSPRQG